LSPLLHPRARAATTRPKPTTRDVFMANSSQAKVSILPRRCRAEAPAVAWRPLEPVRPVSSLGESRPTPQGARPVQIDAICTPRTAMKKLPTGSLTLRIVALELGNARRYA
jgi:hypothetical protein